MYKLHANVSHPTMPLEKDNEDNNKSKNVRHINIVFYETKKWLVQPEISRM